MIFEKSDPGMFFDGKPLSLGLPSRSLSGQWGQNGVEARQLRETSGSQVYAISLFTICYAIISIAIRSLFHWRRVGKPLFKGSVPHKGRDRATNIRRLAAVDASPRHTSKQFRGLFSGGRRPGQNAPSQRYRTTGKNLLPGFYSGSAHFRIVLAARGFPPGFFRTFSTPFR